MGEDVKISGFIQTKRDHGKITFLDVTDQTGLIQVVVAGAKAVNLHPQDVVLLVGKVNKRPSNLVNPKLVTGKIEIYTDKVEVLSQADELPFDMGGKGLDLKLPTLLDWRSLTLRHPKVKAIFKIQAAILAGFRKIVTDLGCVEILVPTIVASATEGGAAVFKVDYYDHKAYLAQSPQLYKQMLVPVFERVFTIAHAYRAEPSVTTRHLSEVVQLDCEFGFVEFSDLLDLLEEVAVKTVKYVTTSCKDIFEEYDLPAVAFGQIPRLTLREVQEIILKDYGRDNRLEKDLTPQDEQDLCKWARAKYNSDFVTVTHFPTQAKPFYTKPDPKDPKYSLSYDLLFRGVEILSGSQRINDYDELVVAIKKHGMDPKKFEMYLQAFKFGMPSEGGFSFGLERLTMCILNLANIRQASLYPRDMERVDIRLGE